MQRIKELDLMRQINNSRTLDMLDINSMSYHNCNDFTQS
jgi:hypothetical protein